MPRVSIPGFECSRCGHVWVARGDAVPKLCPRCKSPLWDKPIKPKAVAKPQKKPWEVVDNPNVNRMTIQILAVVAENEVKAISERTKAALAAKKARGGLLGASRPGAPQITREAGRKGSAAGARSMRKLAEDAYTDLIPALREMRTNGLSLHAIAARLDAEGHTTRRGRSWTPTQVSRVIARWPERKLG